MDCAVPKRALIDNDICLEVNDEEDLLPHLRGAGRIKFDLRKFAARTDTRVSHCFSVHCTLSECFLLIRKRSIAIVSPWGWRWKVAVSSSFLSSARGSLILLNPLLPLGRVFVCHLSPISISPEGVCAFNLQSVLRLGRPDQSSQVFTFDEITRVARRMGKYLDINDARFVECGDTEQARALAEIINSAVRSSPAERETMLRGYIVKRFDGKAASLRLMSEKVRLNVIRASSLVFFLLLFFTVPVLVSIYGLEPVIIPTALMMVTFAVYISVLFFLVHRSLYPELREERFGHLAKMIFCPPGAIRAADVVAANLVASYDPVVVASLFHSPDTDEFIGSYARDLKFPINDDLTEPHSAKIAQWYRTQLLDRVLEHLQKTGHRGVFLGPKIGEEIGSYCPRCLGRFQVNSGECVDCPGVSLIATLATPTNDAVVQNHA